MDILDSRNPTRMILKTLINAASLMEKRYITSTITKLASPSLIPGIVGATGTNASRYPIITARAKSIASLARRLFKSIFLPYIVSADHLHLRNTTDGSPIRDILFDHNIKFMRQADDRFSCLIDRRRMDADLIGAIRLRYRHRPIRDHDDIISILQFYPDRPLDRKRISSDLRFAIIQRYSPSIPASPCHGKKKRRRKQSHCYDDPVSPFH